MINLIYTQLKSQLHIKRLIAIQLLILLVFGALSISDWDLTEAFKENKKLTLGVINEDDNPLINVLIDSFEDNDAFTAQFDLKIDDNKSVIDAFYKGTVDAYIIIPNGFTESLMGYDRQSLSLYTKAGFPTQRELLKGIFTSYIDYVKLSNAATITLYQHLSAQGLDGETLSDINNKFSFKVIQTAMARQSLFDIRPIDEMANANSDTYYALMLTLSLISFLLIALCAQNLEFIAKSLGARISLAVPTIRYVTAIHMAQCGAAILGVISALIYLSVFVHLNVVKVFIAIVLLTLFWSNVFFTMALWSSRAEQYTMTAIPIAVLSMGISGTFTPYSLLPHHLKRLAMLTPQFNAAAFVMDFNSYRLDVTLMYIGITALLFYVQMVMFPFKIRGEH